MPRDFGKRFAKNTPTVPASDLMQVMDMGLDFRSYQNRVDDAGQRYLGNVVAIPVDKVADVFEPTVGLLVTILHLHCQSTANESARRWLTVYDITQKIFVENHENKLESRRSAEESRRVINAALTAGSQLPDMNLTEKLLIELERQSGIHGNQAPSQRRIPKDPKGTFCNLHLSDHKCNQEFSCNQLHFHQAGPVKHRIDFHLKLIEILVKEKLTQGEILHRVKDSLLYARYGNKVSVRSAYGWVPFFKTVYTKGRLDHALRISNAVCTNRHCADPQCPGVHVQDERQSGPTKQMDLPQPASEVAVELEQEALQLWQLHLEKLSSVSETEGTNSPTSAQWRNTVRDYVRQAGIHEGKADDALLLSLQGAPAGTPMSTSADAFTPLMHELDLKRFDSKSSMDDQHQ